MHSDSIFILWNYNGVVKKNIDYSYINYTSEHHLKVMHKSAEGRVKSSFLLISCRFHF